MLEEALLWFTEARVAVLRPDPPLDLPLSGQSLRIANILSAKARALL